MAEKKEPLRITNEDYHARPEISKSQLDRVARAFCFLGRTQETTPAMAIGTAVHTATFEPETFNDLYAVMQPFNRRTNVGKAQYAQFCAQNIGKTVLTMEENELISGASRAIRRHPIASKMLDDGEPELSFLWSDEETGVECRCRPDWWRGKDNLIVDLKTTRDASYHAFQKSVVNFRYHVQAAFYMDGLRANGLTVDTWCIIAVENTEPFALAVYNLDEIAIERGRELYRKDLATIKRHRDTPGAWQGYPLKIEEMSLPKWALG